MQIAVKKILDLAINLNYMARCLAVAGNKKVANDLRCIAQKLNEAISVVES